MITSWTRRLTSALLQTVALLLWTTIAWAQSPATDSVSRLDSAWARSYEVHDTATAQALFASDVIVVGGNGTLKDRYAGACAVVGVAEWEFEFNGRVDATRRR